MTKWFKTENERLSPDDDQFIRVVRLIKKFARSRKSWKGSIATGFMISKLASESFVWRPERDDESLRETLKAIQGRLQVDIKIKHPTLAEYMAQDDDARPAYLKDRLDEKLPILDVLDGASCTHEEAMKAWDDFFGTDWFSQQPEPTDEQGGGWDGGLPALPKNPVDKQGGGRFA